MRPPSLCLTLVTRRYASGASKGAHPHSHRAPPLHLRFPRQPNPSPFEIFHLSPSSKTTTAEIKARYYDLVKLYHPDKTASTSSPQPTPNAAEALDGPARRFQMIVDAYELLRSPTRRQLYLRTGTGWSYGVPSLSRSPRTSHDRWAEDRQRAARARYASSSRPHFASAAWDWVRDRRRGRAGDGDGYGHGDGTGEEFWTSNSNASGGQTFREQWDHQGAVARNGAVLSGVACVSLALYGAQAFRVWRAGLDEDEDEPVVKKEPQGDDRLDADLWASTSASATSTGGQRYSNSSAALAPMYVSPLVKAAEERHRNASGDLRDARQGARAPREFNGRVD